MCRTYINKDGLKVILPAAIWDEIVAEVTCHYPNECGGIFTGRIDISNNTAIIEQMLKPSKIVSTPVLFKRFAKSINSFLLQLFKKNNGESYYLGEWHSHPNGRPTPSNTDFATMRRIANSKSLTIKTPLMLIVGFNNSRFDEQFYIFHNNRLVNYERQ